MEDSCTIYKTTSFIGKRWTLLILLELYKGNPKTKRYFQLKDKLLEITPKILSKRLKELEKEGLIVKKVDAKTFPVKCNYHLTKRGEEFIKIIKGIKKWALKWKYKNKNCEDLDCKECEI